MKIFEKEVSGSRGTMMEKMEEGGRGCRRVEKDVGGWRRMEEDGKGWRRMEKSRK